MTKKKATTTNDNKAYEQDEGYAGEAEGYDDETYEKKATMTKPTTKKRVTRTKPMKVTPTKPPKENGRR